MGRQRLEFLRIFVTVDNSFIDTLKEAMLFDSKNTKNAVRPLYQKSAKRKRHGDIMEGGYIYDSSRNVIMHASSHPGISSSTAMTISSTHNLSASVLGAASSTSSSSGPNSLAAEEQTRALALTTYDESSLIPKDILKYSSQQEINERIRSIKSYKLANAITHPSYQLLSEDAKSQIKEQWLSMLLN
jgi:hypothetical protein